MRHRSRSVSPRLIGLAALALAASAVAPETKADHWACSGSATVPLLRFPGPRFVDLSGFKVGDVIEETTLDAQAHSVQCTRVVNTRTMDGEGLIATASYAMANPNPVSGMPGVYATPGSPVGFRVSLSLPGAGTSFVAANTDFEYRFVEKEGAVPVMASGTLLRIEALKVGSGALPSEGTRAYAFDMVFESNYLREIPGTGYVAAGISLGRMNSAGSYRFVPQPVPTCSMLQSDVSVDLGAVEASSLANANDVSPPVFHPLRIQCAGGGAGQKVAASVHFTDASNAANTTDRLTLAGGATASGVAVRILKDGVTPIVFGPESAWESGWKLGSWANGEQQVPLGFQLIRTDGALGGGTVRAMATYIMTYE
jgi:type 1 fimbria pilin